MKTEDLIDSISSDNKPTSFLKPCILFYKWLGFSLVYSAILIAVKGLRGDITEELKNIYFASEIIFAIATVTISGYFACLLSVPDEDRPKIYKYLFLLPLTLLGVSIFLSGDINKEALRESMEDKHFMITLVLAIYSIVPTLYLFSLVKKLSPTSPGLVGILVIIANAASAHIFVRLTEEADNIASVMAWCYLPIILISFTGIYFGRKLLRW